MGTKQRWRFIDSGNQDAALNMAIDEAILTLHSQNKVPPTIRFYGWNPSALSIGYFQQAKQEIYFPALKKYGLDFVRRATGGRAVLHDRELTYSVVLAESYADMPTSVTESYRLISTGLLYGFRHLGLDANFAIPKQSSRQQKGDRSAVCFDAPSGYELVVEGRKVAGSAQTRKQGTILQHGSILLDLNVDMLFDVFRFANERVKERLKTTFTHKAVAINQLLDDPIELDQVKQAFRAGFAEGLDINLVEGQLTQEERKLAEELVATKYLRDEWNYKK